MRFRVEGLGCGKQVIRVRVWGLRFRVEGLGCGIQVIRVKVWGLRVVTYLGFGFRI